MGTDGTSDNFRLPPSGVILGAIAKALDLNPVGDTREVFSDRTLLRYFKGERLDDESKRKVLVGYADSLIKTGLLPIPHGFEERKAELVSGILTRHTEAWDGLHGWMASIAAPVLRPELAPRPYLRLAVVDLALRAAAASSMGIDDEKFAVLETETPMWAEGSNAGNLLNRLREEAHLTRDELTDFAVGAGMHTTVDRWLDGRVQPSEESVEKIASVIGPRLAVPPDAVVARLRAHYALRRLADVLAEHVGRKQVVWLARGYARLRRRTLTLLRVKDVSRENRVAFALLGAQAPNAEVVLETLWNEETSPLWATELRAVSGPWTDRLQQTARTMAAFDSTEGKRQFAELPQAMRDQLLKWREVEGFMDLAQADMTRLTPAMLKGKEGEFLRVQGGDALKATNQAIQGEQALADGDRAKALEHYLRAAELQPKNATYRYLAGCSQWQYGLQTGKPALVRAGIESCEAAHNLHPEWDKPLVEIGLIHLSMDQNAKALTHLEGVAEKIPMTPWLAYNLGVARMRADKFTDAFALFEVAIKAKPDDALALDLAANCAFMLGKNRDGEKLAKRARDLGQPGAYVRWEAGFYKVAREAENAPTPAKRAFAKGELAFLGGDRREEVKQLKEAVTLDPENADYHLRLGAALWQTGDVDEGIHECWCAARLDPKSDKPLVEIGVALESVGRRAEAIKHLEDSLTREPGATPLLRYTLGVTKLHANDFLGGLVIFESVTNDEPTNGYAWDGAAKCAFMARDEKKGQKYAERAHKLGQDGAYRLWKTGEFKRLLDGE